jgi:hypothetical protein
MNEENLISWLTLLVFAFQVFCAFVIANDPTMYGLLWFSISSMWGLLIIKDHIYITRWRERSE